MASSVLVSRCDRIGDLILSLPAVAYIKQNLAQGSHLSLHISEYARDVGDLALSNGIADSLVFEESEEAPKESYDWALSLFHSPKLKELFARWRVQNSLGPRSKISTLWTYSKTVAQHRSRVEKSEMEYNVDLARALLDQMGVKANPFEALPALQLPKPWGPVPSDGADVLVAVSNGNSAANWSMSRYIELIQRCVEKGESVEVLISGHDAAERLKEFCRSSLSQHPMVRLTEKLPSLKGLLLRIAASGRLVASSTGPLHMGHALGKEVLGVYPRTPRVQSFKRWRPAGYRHGQAIYWESVD